MRAAKEGMLSEDTAFLDAYCISEIISDCSDKGGEIEKILLADFTEEEKKECAEWCARMSTKY